jgi:multicomponent K+:H+ antiporter subunit E
MSVWLPHPILSACLLATWLLLNAVSAGHILLGTLLALAGGRILAVLQGPRTPIANARAVLRLVGAVIADVVRSNLAVARIVISPRHKDLTSGFVEIPLTLRHPLGLAVLACIITATPGTLWVEHDSGRGVLTIHVLDLLDEQTWIDHIKTRYERRLLEIFP